MSFLGKEDLRLDERVMQLFDLMNSLIKMNNNLRKKDIEVIKYSIIPMTNENGLQSGLVRWIDNSGSKSTLIKFNDCFSRDNQWIAQVDPSKTIKRYTSSRKGAWKRKITSRYTKLLGQMV